MSHLKYNILQPKNPTPNPPLLVMLHGYGSDDNDLFSFADSLNDRFLVVSARAPRQLPWGGYAWYDINFTNSAERFGDPVQALESMGQIVQLIEEVKEKYKTGKTILLGFSQGAILSYALSMHHPQKIDKVLALSGYLFKELIPNKLDSKAMGHLEYFVSHGVVDEVIPIDWARATQKWLQAHDLVHQYKEYNMGHGINPNCFQDLLQWIAERYELLA